MPDSMLSPAPSLDPSLVSDGRVIGSVLVVDDDRIAAESLADGLRSEGWHVKIASSAEEALEMIPGLELRAVVLDLVLPFMSGMVLARQLKSDPATQALNVVATAKVIDAAAEQLVREAGCAGCVRKPSDPPYVSYLLRTSAPTSLGGG